MLEQELKQKRTRSIQPSRSHKLTEIKGHDILLIHGLWMTPASWGEWKKRFSAHGYNVITPGWPGIDEKSVEEIRHHPDFLRGLGLTQIVDHYATLIRQMEKPPIIIGHSIGGLITQLLLNRALGCAGVAINSVQTKGVIRIPPSVIKAAWPALKNPFNLQGLAELTFEEFKYAFCNGMSEKKARAAFDEYYIPGPTRPLIQAAVANFTPSAASTVDYNYVNRAPLLFISGGRDTIVPASLNKENANRYKTKSNTDYFEFAERNHFTCGAPGWEEVADFALNWALDQVVMEENRDFIQ